jgi:hypothetical protein
MKAIWDHGCMAMRPDPFTLMHQFLIQIISPKSFCLVGAHGNAPDDHGLGDEDQRPENGHSQKCVYTVGI